jgi:histidine ammonia-lyase
MYLYLSVVSENKGLCHPSSVDTIATSAGQEDHVSMGAWSARKALMVIDNVEKSNVNFIRET